MTGWQLTVAMILYIWVGIDLWIEGKSGLALSFFGYAFSNIGLIWAAHQ
jgi:hypothetical protein